MISFTGNWVKRNFSLVLLLMATVCLAQALGEVIRGATWSLLMPVSLAAALCGWGLSSRRLTPKQAWVSLTGLGLPGVFAYVAGLFLPLGRLILASLSLIPQVILWVFERTSIDFSSLFTVWTEFSSQVAGVLTPVVGLERGTGQRKISSSIPLAAALVWNLLLMVGVCLGGLAITTEPSGLAGAGARGRSAGCCARLHPREYRVVGRVPRHSVDTDGLGAERMAAYPMAAAQGGLCREYPYRYTGDGRADHDCADIFSRWSPFTFVARAGGQAAQRTIRE